jgi:hypothetical protein
MLFTDTGLGFLLHAVSISGFLLRLDDAVELLLLLFGLDDHSDLLFLCLLLSCLVEISVDFCAVLSLLALLLPFRSFLGFRCSLRPQRVQFRLTISSLLLQLAQPLHLLFLLQLDAFLLLDHLLLFPSLLDVVGYDLIILLTLDSLLLFLDGDRLIVGVLDFEEKASLGFNLFLHGLGLLFLEDLDLPDHLLAFLLELLLLTDSDHLTLLDLVLDDQRALLAINGILPLTLLVELDHLESLDFHH